MSQQKAPTRGRGWNVFRYDFRKANDTQQLKGPQHLSHFMRRALYQLAQLHAEG